MKHIHTLTGLRGLAALIVFISHSANESVLPKILGYGFGQIGVMLFFVLSGFLMSHLYIHEEFNKENVRKFVLARIGRVIPLYFLLLIFSVVITHYVSPESFFPFKFYNIDEAVRALLLIDAIYIFWTIPVEMQFYAVFIGFWALYKKGFDAYSLLAFILITMVPSVLIYLALSRLPNTVSTFSYAFFLGSITALIFEKIRNNETILKGANIVGIPALLLLFINLPVLRHHYGLELKSGIFFQTWGDPITWAIVYIIFICAVLNSRSVSILNSKFLVHLGNISYGFYLFHYPILMFFVKEVNINPLAKFILAFIFAAAISHVSFYYFEMPIGRRIRNFGQSKSI